MSLENLYTDPYEREVLNQYPGRDKTSAGKAVFGLLKNMLIFGAVIGGVKEARKYMGGQIGKIFSNVSKNIPLFRDSSKFFGVFSNFKTQIKDNITSNFASSVSVYDEWKRNWNERYQYLKKTKVGAFSEKIQDLIGYRYSRFNKDKLANFWSPSQLGQRLTGKIVKGATSYFEFSTDFYFANKLLGIVSPFNREKSPAWYNIPGMIKDYAKFAWNTFPVQMAFGLIGPTFGLTKEASAGVLSSLGKKTNISSWLPTFLHKTASKVSDITAHITGAGSFYNSLRYNAKAVFSPMIGKEFSYAKTQYKQTVDHYLQSFRKLSATNELEIAMKEIDGINAGLTDPQKVHFLNRWVRKYRPKPVSQFFRRTLGLRTPALSGKDMEFVLRSYKDPSTRDSWKRSLESLSNKGVPLYDKGIYLRGHGTQELIDLRTIRPGHLFRKFMNFSTQHLKLGQISIPGLFLTDTLVRHKPIIRKLTPGEKIPLGLNFHGTEMGTVTIGHDLESLFVGGGYFTIAKGADGSKPIISLLNPGKMTFKEMATGMNSMERQVMNNYIKANSLNNKSDLEHLREMPPVAKFIYKTGDWLDIKNFMGRGSIGGYIKGMVQKYFDKSYPGNLLELSKQAAVTNEEPIRKSFKDSLKILIGKDSAYASKLFKNPRILSSFGIDPAMSYEELYKTASSRVKHIDEILGGNDMGNTLLRRYKVKELLNQVRTDSTYQGFSNTVKRIGFSESITAKDNLLEFLAMDNIFRKGLLGGQLGAIDDIVSDLLANKTVNDFQASVLKVHGQGIMFDNIMRRNNFQLTQDSVKQVTDVVSRYKKDYELVTNKLFKPFTSIVRSDEMDDIMGSIEYINGREQLPWHGFVTMPELRTKAKFFKSGETYENIDTGKAQTIDVGGGNVFFERLAYRFNNVTQALGLGLDMSRYKTGSDYLWNGLLAKRALPLAGLVTAFGVADMITDICPLFSGSLPYNELILIQHQKNKRIELVEIGKFVEEYKYTEYYAWTNYNGWMDWCHITGGIKHKRVTPVARIQLEKYADIYVTTNHSLFTGVQRYLEKTEPKLGTYILAAYKMPKQENIIDEICILDNIINKEKYICHVKNLNYHIMNYIKNRKNGYKNSYICNLDEEYLNWVEKYVHYYKFFYKVDIDDVRKLDKKYYKDINLFWKEGKVEIPIIYNLDYNFGRLLGFYVSEGGVSIDRGKRGGTSILSFSADEKYKGYKGNIREKIIYDINYVFKEKKIKINKRDIKINSILYAKLFKDLFGCGQYPQNKRIPNFVLNSNSDIKKGFLEGYFLGDGNWSHESLFVFTTSSRKLAIQLVYLLKQFNAQIGIYSRFRKDNCERINGRKIQPNFREYDIIARSIKIGSFDSKKSIDIRAKRKDNFSSRINEIEVLKEQPEYVYDISVQGSEKFVGGFYIYAHNTALDEGIGVAAAEQAVKARMFLSSLYDTFGVTESSKYAEGLMPGFINSTAMRAFRGVLAPVYLGAKVGGGLGGPQGAGLGMLAGVGLGALQGFGALDLTKSREELEEMYSGREEVPVRSGRWWQLSASNFQGGRCLTKNSEILCSNGVKKISDIRIGDIVINDRGESTKVIFINNRALKNNEKVYSICSSFDKTDKIEVTEDHLIKVLRTNKCKCHEIACLNRDMLICKKCKHHFYKNYKEEWVKCKDLGKYDFLIYPIISKKENIYELDLINLFPDYKFENDKIYIPYKIYKPNNSINKYIEQWNDTKDKCKRKELKTFILNNGLKESQFWSRLQTIQESRRNKYYGYKFCGYSPSKIKLTKEFGKLIGYYLAEGSKCKNSINLSFSSNENIYINEIKNVCNNIFKRYIKVKQGNGNSKILDINFFLLYQIINKFFPEKSKDKNINNYFLNSPFDFKMGVLEAFINGDGSCKKNKCLINICCTSYVLLKQFQTLLSSIDIYSSLSSRYQICNVGNKIYNELSYSLFISGIYCEKLYTYFDYLEYGIQTTIKNKNHIRKDRGFFNNNIYSPIIKKEIIEYNDSVYDIQVEKGDSFLSKGIILHNCMYFRPHGFARLKSKYKTSPDGLGSPIEQLLFRPVPFLGFNPLGYLIDKHHYCIHPNQFIQIKNGWLKKISDIGKNDEVLNGNGQFEKVNNIYKRKINRNEKMFSFKLHSIPFDDLKVTDNHLIYGIKTEKCKIKFTTMKIYCQYYSDWVRCKKCKNKRVNEPQWIKSIDLNKGDYIGYPILEFDKINSIRILDYIDKTKHRINQYYVFKNTSKNNVKDTMKLNFDFGKIIGYYLSEGCSYKTKAGRYQCLSFGFNKNEKDTYVKDLKDTIKNYFNLDAHVYDKEHVLILELSNNILTELFYKLFGVKKNKNIPSFLLGAPDEFLYGLLLGYINGDGSYINTRDDITMGSVCLQLLVQIRNILLKLGYISSLQVRDEEKDSYIKGRKTHCAKSYTLGLYGKNAVDLKKIMGLKVNFPNKNNRNQGCFFKDGYVFIRINEKKEIQYNGFVYDLGLKKEHSFCTSGCKIHNSYRKYYSQPFPECVDLNTKIQGDNDLKLAKDIKIGDKVLTHEGKYELILDILYKYQKEAYIIKTYGYFENLIVGQEHPFLIAECGNCFYTRNNKYIKKCLSVSNHKICRENCKKRIEPVVKWEHVKNLKIGDFIAYPRIKLNEEIHNINMLDYLTPYKSRIYFENNKYIEMKHDYEIQSKNNVALTGIGSIKLLEYFHEHNIKLYELAKMLGYSAYQTVSAILHKRRGTSLHKLEKLKSLFKINIDKHDFEFTKWGGIRKSPAKPIIKNIALDHDFGFLCGLYLAEGWIGKKEGYNVAISTVHNKPEDKIAYERLEKIFKYKFNISGSIQLDEHYIIYAFCNSIMADFIYNFLGDNSYYKHLPYDFIKYPMEFLLGILNGYFLGDGKVNRKESFSASSVCLFLLVQVKNLLCSLGIISSIIKRENDYQLNISGKFTKIFLDLLKFKGKYDKLTSPSISRQFRAWLNEDYIFYKIETLQKITYNKEMIDFVVSNSHSFCGASHILHNTSVAFNEMPFIGPAMAATAGRLLTPPKRMHKEELKAALGFNDYVPYVRQMPGGGTAAGYSSPFKPGTIEMNKLDSVVSGSSLTQSLDEQLYRFTEGAGLLGFGLETMNQKMFGFSQPFESQSIMANASDITSVRRAYWDLSIGDPLGTTEILRRFIPRSRKHLNMFNPLINCLTENSEVLMSNYELKKVKNLNINDEILSNKGIRKIKYLQYKKCIGEIYKIKWKGGMFSEPKFTPEHKIYVISTKNCHCHPKRKSICINKRKQKICVKCGYNNFNEKRYETHKHYLDYKPDWKQAKQIDLNDYVLYPVLQTDEVLKDISFEQISSRIKKKIGKISLDYDFGYLSGLYIAEGSSSQRGNVTKFALNIDEKKLLANDISKILKEKFNINTANKNDNDHSKTLVCLSYSKQLNNIFSKLYGNGAENKKIPSEFLFHAPKKFLIGLLHGYFEGDGSIKDSSGKLMSATISKILARQIIEIGLKFDLYFSLCHSNFKSDKNHMYFLSLSQACRNIFSSLIDKKYGYKLKNMKVTSENSCNNWFFYNDGQEKYIARRVCCVEVLKYNGLVYDLGIEENEHAFCVDSYLVHNSQPCLIGGSEVQVNWGKLEKVEDVKENDRILTHKGKLKKVLKRMVNDYNDDIYNIVSYGNNIEKLWVTKMHPFYIERNNKKMWIKAKDIQIKDYILLPICQKNNLNSINISKFVKNLYKKGEYIYCGKTNHSALLLDKLKLDYDFGRICGFYLSEGHLGNCEVSFTFGIHEDKYINELKNIFYKKFRVLNYSVKKIPEESKIRVSIYSKILRDLFLELFGEVKGKHIHSFLMNSNKSFLKGLLDAYIQGDGYYYRETRNRSYIRTVSVCKELIVAIRNILAKFNILSNLTLEKADVNHIKSLNPNAICQEIAFGCIIRGNDVEEMASKLFNVKPIKKQNILRNKIDEKYIYFRVRKINKRHYKGKIYNFKIEDDNSYCSISYSLHNSWMPDKFHIGAPVSFVPEAELLMPGTGYCILPDVELNINGNVKLAKDVQIGDEVITFNGTKSLVKDIYKREVSEDIYKIKYYGMFVDPLKVTYNHQVLAVKVNACYYRKDKKRQPCKPNLKYNSCNSCKYKYFEQYKPDWIESQYLEEGDYLLYPIWKSKNKDKIKEIEILNYIDGNKVRYDRKSGLVRPVRYYNEQYIFNHGLGFPPTLKLDEELGYILGYYLAEGWISNNQQIIYCLNLNEKNVAKKIKKYFNQYKIHVSIKKRIESSSYIVEIDNNIISLFIKSFLGKDSYTKHLPPFITRFPREFIYSLLAGYFDGDGYNGIINNKQRLEYSSVNLNLLLEIRLLLLKLGILSSIREVKEKMSFFNGEVINSKESYTLSILGGKSKNIFLLFGMRKNNKNIKNNKGINFILDGYLYQKIFSIEKEYYRGEVYDFSVEKNYSFASLGAILHNSSTHDVTMSYPVHAEMLGLDPGDTVRSMLGLYPKNYSKYQHNSTDIDRVNRNILAANTIFDPYHDISGMHDGIIKMGRNSVVKKIKDLSDKELASFIGPANSDISELNFYLRQLRIPMGMLSYTFNGEPVMTYPVKYSEARYLRDVNVVREARNYASMLYEKGVGFPGEGYSHIDRLNILCNLAPYSDQYKEEELIVRMQMKAGFPIKEQHEKIQKKRKAMLMKYELYPYRFCIFPDLLINTKIGLKKAIDINIGDEVFGKDGNYHIVEYIFIRNKTNNDEMLSFYIDCQRVQSLDITKNHEILAVRKGVCKKRGKFRCDKFGYYPCKPNHNISWCGSCNNPEYINYKAEWIPANNLNIGDFIAYPKIKFNGGGIIDLSKLMNSKWARYDNNNVWILNAMTGKERTGSRNKRYIELNDDIYKLIGYYLAEGSNNSEYQIYFDLHRNEDDIINDIIQILQHNFSSISYNIKCKGNSKRLQITSRALAKFLMYVAGRGKNKLLNYDIICKDGIYNLINGYWLGDGNHKKVINDLKRIKSSNLSLLFQIRDVLLSLGYSASIYKADDEKPCSISGRVGVSKESYYLNFNTKKELFILGDYVLFEIKDIKDKDINFKLYDFQVKDVQSYSPMGFIIHNSGKVMTPDSEYNSMSLNENIKAASEYSYMERVVGSAWERLSHLSSPINSKFMPYRTPLEAYQRSTLYGRDFKMWCIKDDTLIFTNNGVKKSRDILVGDMVRGKDCKMHKVKNIWINDMRDVHQKMKSITVASISIPVCVTEGHVVFASKDKGNSIVKCQVKDLNFGDYLIYSIPEFKDDNTYIDLSQFINSNMVQITDTELIPLTYLRHGPYKVDIKPVPDSHYIPRFIKKTLELYRLLGYYAAEGGSGKSVRFSFHCDEIIYHNEVIEYMDKIFHIKKYTMEHKGKGIRISFHSSVLGHVFGNIFGKNVQNKKISYDIFNTNKKHLLAFITGYINGDGHVHKNDKQITIVSKKIDLLVLVRDLLLNFDIISGIRKRKLYNSYILYISGKNSIKLRKLLDKNYKNSYGNNSLYFIKNNMLFCKIRKINTIQYEGKVYDFEIEDEHSYTGISFIFHNSHPIDHFLSAYARGFMSKTTPFQGSLAGLMAGTIIGGPGLGSAIGAGVGCYDERTECLTQKGWVKYNEITLNDNVLEYDKNSQNLKWSKIKDVYIHDYKGEMYHLKSRIYDLLISPEHRILYYSQDSYFNRKKLVAREKKIKDVSTIFGLFPQTGNGNWNGGNYDGEIFIHGLQHERIKINPILLLKFAGFYVAEGHRTFDNSYKVCVSQNHGVYFNWIIDIIENMGFNYYINHENNDNEPCKRIVISCKDLWVWIAQFGDGAENKMIPDWVLELDKEYLEAFFEGYLKGDGCFCRYKTNEKYSIGISKRSTTISEGLIDKLQILYLKLGMVTTKQFNKCNNSYELSSHIKENGENKWYSYIKTRNIKKEYYSGKIWDINIDGGYFVVRRNGRIAISGNSIYGGIHGIYRSMVGSTYIPGEIKEARNLNRYFDKISYVKNMMLYNATGDNKFSEEAKGTMTGLVPSDNSRASWGHMYRATPPQERPFIMSFLSEQDPEERSRILKYVPEEVGELLKTKWAVGNERDYNARISMGQTLPLPSPDWIGYAKEIPIEDVKVKYIENRGMSAHDFGLGFYEQANRINNSPWLGKVAVDMDKSTDYVSVARNQNVTEVRRTIEIFLQSQNIHASIKVISGISNNITIINE